MRVGKGALAPCPPSSIPLVSAGTLQLWPTSALGGIAEMAGLAAGSTRSRMTQLGLLRRCCQGSLFCGGIGIVFEHYQPVFDEVANER